LCKDTIDGLKKKISYDEQNLVNWRRSRIPEIKRFADAAGIKTASTFIGISEEATPLCMPSTRQSFLLIAAGEDKVWFPLGADIPERLTLSQTSICPNSRRGRHV
jgi:hypothetical protein